MKHKLVDDLNANVTVEHTVTVPAQDISDILDKVASTAIKIIGAYMVADVIRHQLKS